MAISGYCLDDDNENASDAFGQAMYRCRELVENWLEDDVPDDEPAVMGYIAAIQVLAEVEPMVAGYVAPKFRVKKWKEAFNSWCDKYEKKIKVKRGVDRKAMRAKALAQFDLLMKTSD